MPREYAPSGDAAARKEDYPEEQEDDDHEQRLNPHLTTAPIYAFRDLKTVG
ncbi:unnamed protein product, partial [marine sediment metagenome]